MNIYKNRLLLLCLIFSLKVFSQTPTIYAKVDVDYFGNISIVDKIKNFNKKKIL